MKFKAKLRQPVALLSVLILTLVLVTKGNGLNIFTAGKFFTKLMNVATKGASGLAGHTWNVVSFKTVETGWNGLFEAIFPKDDKVANTMEEILDRFDKVEDMVSMKT
jgi:hypothetical protein